MAADSSKTLQHTRRGLKLVGSKSLFDLDEPNWIADDKAVECQKCKVSFSFLVRRHHCRRCGKIFCGKCCVEYPLPRMGFVDPVLVCHECLPKCRSEDAFYKSHLKALTSGANFTVAEDETVYMCRLSENHYEILFDPYYKPIQLKNIAELAIESEANQTSVLKIKCAHRVEVLKPSLENKKASIDWMKALKKAMLLLHNKLGASSSS